MKTFKIILITFLLSILPLIYAVIYFGHPNDSRVHMPNIAKLKYHDEFEERSYSLFASKKNHFSIDIDINSYKSILDEEKKSLETNLEYNSARFSDDFQIYLTLGSHPVRVEGRNGVAIPAGKKLTFTPAVSGYHRIDFGAASSKAENMLELLIDKKSVKSWGLNKITPPIKYNEYWYKNFGKFLNPDPIVSGGSWQDYSSSIGLTINSVVTLSCKGKKGVCFVSEPSVWKKSSANKQNVLFILVDTMRHDAINSEDAPFLHGLTQKSLFFSETLAAGNMTSPSTNALLSCRKPSDLGKLAFSYHMDHSIKESHYLERKASFPEIFRKNGWETAMIGNISVISEVLGASIDHGFKHQIAIEQEAYDTPQITREAIRWLKDNGTKPFFLYLHYHGPHAPYRAPATDIWKTFSGVQSIFSYPATLKWLYKSEIHFTDRYIKKVIQALNTLGLADNTTLLITADHGDHHEARTFIDNEGGPAFTGAFFDHGATLLNDEIKVPLIIKVPHLGKPEKVGIKVSGLDIAPTLLDLFGLPIPAWCSGESLMPIIKKENDPKLGSRTFGFEGFRRRGILHANRYKYIKQYQEVRKRVYNTSRIGGKIQSLFQEELLFDLKQDPHEQNNLIFLRPELKTQMLKEFNRYYNIDYQYQLVIENPNGKKITLIFPEGANIPKLPSLWSHKQQGKNTIYISPNHIKNEAIIFKSSKPFLPTPEIFIEESNIPVLFTKMKIPIHCDQDKLPVENQGLEELMTNSKTATAYIRKVEANHMLQRKIQLGNAKIEQMLKDWGYLNEES